MSVPENQDALLDEVQNDELFSESQSQTIESHELFEKLSVAQAALRRIAFTYELGNFSAPLSNLKHGHKYDKHDVRDFGVTDELISKHLITHHCDHAALWELTERKDELINSDTPVFNGKPDDHSETWERIESLRDSAPVPDFIQSTVKK